MSDLYQTWSLSLDFPSHAFNLPKHNVVETPLEMIHTSVHRSSISSNKTLAIFKFSVHYLFAAVPKNWKIPQMIPQTSFYRLFQKNPQKNKRNQTFQKKSVKTSCTGWDFAVLLGRVSRDHHQSFCKCHGSAVNTCLGAAEGPYRFTGIFCRGWQRARRLQ